MDNITHTLIGAVLGQAGLKRRTGLAMPALMLAANLPDIDAPCVVFGTESLAMRRGVTHGPIALALLPLALAVVLFWFDHWQERRGRRPGGRLPVHFGWLLALCYIGALTHPTFDWLNNYGIRLLEPFSHRWFYGDALFIVDPWILGMLGAGIWLSLRRERAGVPSWTRPARAAIAGVLAFVAVNLAISRFAASTGDFSYQWERDARPDLIVANAVPVAFWRRDVLWRGGGEYGVVPVSLFDPRNIIGHSENRIVASGKTNMADPRIAARAADDPAAWAYLFWSRMPVAEYRGNAIVLRDQRFMQAQARGSFSVELKSE